ncbi:MAG: hypothetical protein L0Y38_06015 [Methylococcaceae bacterium]|nr:hypothetical protein [Methylococcaceae bacterium]MCI0668291.1 hypothetical protein [Methylococcaceae bacterium]MCI0733361.1 hypothetical protein [Methylococcaceae bacterium]
MKTLTINDLTTDKELDRKAMSEISGGAGDLLPRLGEVDVLSPDFYNKVTPIMGAVSLPTGQTNNLGQTDTTIATNAYGINYVSNNKFASQTNLNEIFDFLNPFVG